MRGASLTYSKLKDNYNFNFLSGYSLSSGLITKPEILVWKNAKCYMIWEDKKSNVHGKYYPRKK